MTLYEMEVARNLLKHDVLGDLIAEVKSLELSQSIRWHHTELPEDKPIWKIHVHQLVDVVYLSNSLVNKMKFGNSGHSFIPPVLNS